MSGRVPALCSALPAVLLALAALLSGCAVPRPVFLALPPEQGAAVAARLNPHSQKMASWTGLAPAVERSLSYAASRPPDGIALERDSLRLTWAQVAASLERFLEILPRLDADPDLLAREFRWFRVGPEPLMTGYYAPFVDASPVRTERYKWPIYGLPEDLHTVDLGLFHHRWAGQTLVYRIQDGLVAPYHDREAIDFGGALAGRGLELAWVADPVDVFFLHIQGSGLLHFPDGTTRYALYAGKNGHKYVSLGRVLADRGHLPLEGMSMQVIREFMASNPDLMRDLLSTNPSYVFFRLGDEGPFGAMNRLLTPLVSVATDPALLPLGSLLVVEATLPPSAPGGLERPVAALALAQDTGGAIKGHRLDYYIGAGPEAAFVAGRIKTPAQCHLLIHRDVLP